MSEEAVNEVTPYRHHGPFNWQPFQILSWDYERQQTHQEQVAGYVNGPFGVFPTANRDWSVTHLPTGLRIALFESPPFDWLWVRDVFIPQVALLFSPDGELLDADSVRTLVKHYRTQGPWA
jgi:hypothetical protein